MRDSVYKQLRLIPILVCYGAQCYLSVHPETLEMEVLKAQGVHDIAEWRGDRFVPS